MLAQLIPAGLPRGLTADTAARATGDITAKVDNIQADAAKAAQAITQITQIIEQINNLQTTIAGQPVQDEQADGAHSGAGEQRSAVEEQTATTNEISAGYAGKVPSGNSAVVTRARAGAPG